MKNMRTAAVQWLNERVGASRYSAFTRVLLGAVWRSRTTTMS